MLIVSQIDMMVKFIASNKQLNDANAKLKADLKKVSDELAELKK